MRVFFLSFISVSMFACAGGDSSMWDGRWAIGNNRLVINAGDTADKKTAYFIEGGEVSGTCAFDDATGKEVVLTCSDEYSDDESYKLTHNGTSISVTAGDKTFSFEKADPDWVGKWGLIPETGGAPTEAVFTISIGKAETVFDGIFFLIPEEQKSDSLMPELCRFDDPTKSEVVITCMSDPDFPFKLTITGDVITMVEDDGDSYSIGRIEG